MIGRLRGILLEKTPPWILIEVMGVGYLLQAPMSTFYHLPSVDKEVILHTHLIVREDAHALYGFASKEECGLFQDFIKINGIGAKAALALLSGMSPQTLKTVISTADVDRLKKIPGIGPKTAQRIIVELQDKKNKWNYVSEMLTTDSEQCVGDSPISQAIQALVALGYKGKEAESAIQKLKDKSMACEEMIKTALQGLAKA